MTEQTPRFRLRGRVRRHPMPAYVAIAYAVSWTLWVPLWGPTLGIEGLPVLPFHHALGAFGPLAAGCAVAAATEGWAGIRALAARTVAWRGRLGWVALAVGGPAAILVLAVAGGAALDGTTPAWSGIWRSSEFPAFSAAGFFAYNVLTFGIGEEVGWRGVAQPWLQRRHSALAATGLVTVMWAGWHAPLFLYRPGYASMGAGGIAGWVLSLFTGAVLLTWLLNGSAESLLVVALFHASIDVVFTSEATSPSAALIAGVLVTLCGAAVLVGTRGRLASDRAPRGVHRSL